MSDENPDVVCANCRYWDSSDGQTGECRRVPPVLIATRNGAAIRTRFPGTPSDAWCGEFDAAIEPPPE